MLEQSLSRRRSEPIRGQPEPENDVSHWMAQRNLDNNNFLQYALHIDFIPAMSRTCLRSSFVSCLGLLLVSLRSVYLHLCVSLSSLFNRLFAKRHISLPFNELFPVLFVFLVSTNVTFVFLLSRIFPFFLLCSFFFPFYSLFLSLSVV